MENERKNGSKMSILTYILYFVISVKFDQKSSLKYLNQAAF